MGDEYEDEACSKCGVERASLDSVGPCIGDDDAPHDWVPYAEVYKLKDHLAAPVEVVCPCCGRPI